MACSSVFLVLVWLVRGLRCSEREPDGSCSAHERVSGRSCVGGYGWDLIEYSMLGPLEVVCRGEVLPITGRNQRIVLAALVGWAGEVVSSERLTGALWGEQPPRSSTKIVQNLIMRLRKTLGEHVIETQPGGYVLRIEPDACDTRRFDGLVASGRAAALAGEWEASARTLAKATELWRGPPLVELRHWEPGLWESVRFEELYRCVVEELAEADLACGRDRDRLALLYKIASEEPLRERRWALLMLALYRCGQQAEALRSFQRAGTALGELGLVPGPELVMLERAISAGDLSLGPETLGRLTLSVVPGPKLGGVRGSVSGNLPAPMGRDLEQLPSGTVTLLFTDVVGSTQLWEEHPHAMREAVARHDEVVRNAIESHGGQVVKMTGDGGLGVFASAHDAIAAAIASQLALGLEPWGATAPHAVRMGIHTGSVELRAGKYFGSLVNRGARLVAVAHGGQVVVSRAAQELVEDMLDESVELVGLGAHRLRDLSHPMEVFQVVAPGLVRDFPALQSLDGLNGNLPLQHSSFVGRDHELVEVAVLLSDARIVTLTGVGGVGKTRIALHVAADVLPRFREGAWLVELDRVRDSTVVVEAVAAVFGVARRQDIDLVETLASFLRSKELLLVLDNCEHLLGEVVALVRALQRKCPNLVVLATSREALGVSGERIVAVASLDLPRSSDRDAVLRSDAVRLFVERAVAVKSDFAVTDANAGSIAEVVRCLDGIPLALELAAARVAVLSPMQIVQRLDQRFRLLSGGERGAIERHATLRAAIDWSYDLLSNDQQTLLARLSVFAGGCSLEAAEAVCSTAGIDEADVLDLLSALVARSLVLGDEAAWGERRYRLLESIRQYAEERLNTAERIDLSDRHVGFYVDFAENAARGLHGPDQLRWVQRTVPELANLRNAMAWALATDDAVSAERFLSSADDLERGPIGAAALHNAEAVLQLPSINTIERYPFALMAGALAAMVRGNHARAEQLCAQALDAASAPNDELEGQAAVVRFNQALRTGDPSRAIEYLELAVRHFRCCASPHQVVRELSVLAAVKMSVGDLAAATDAAREALALARQTGNPGLMSSALAGLAYVLAAYEPERSRALIAESLEFGTIVDDELALVFTIIACAMLGERDQVRRLSARAFDGALTGIPALAPCLETAAEALAAEAPAAAAVLHGYVDAFASYLSQRQPHATFRQRATAAIDAQLDAVRVIQLRAHGAAMTQDEASAYALDVITRILTDETDSSAPGSIDA